MRVALRTAQVRLPISVAAIVAGLVGMLLMAAPAQAANEPEVDGIFYTVDASAGATVTGYDPATGTAATIPAEVTIDSTTYPVTKIGDHAFHKLGLTAISIGSNVTTIGANAFSDNSLTTVTIPDNVTAIGANAFAYNQLTSATLSKNLTEIPAEIFLYNSLTSITIPTSVTTIGESAFLFNQLTSVSLPAGLTSLGVQAFAGNNLTSVTVPSGITTIGSGTFARNALTSVHLPAGLTSIGENAFTVNQLSSIAIPESVTSIGDQAFRYNKLTSITIPHGITAINPSTFDLNNLTEVTIPAGVTSIGPYAFNNNPPLKSVQFLGAAPTVTDANATAGQSFDTASGSLVLSYGAAFGGPGGFTTPTWHGYTTAVNTAPTLTGSSSAAGHVGQSFTYTPSVGGHPAPTVTVSAGTLPPGLHLNAATGAITGTPTTAGSYPVTLKATNGIAPDATRAVTITIGPGIIGLDPTITGDPRVGKTLTAHHGVISPSSAKLTYQWKADGIAISKATKSTLKLGSAQAGRRITVSITGTAKGIPTKTETSSPTKIVSSATPRIVVSAKTIHAGDTFTVTAVGLKANMPAIVWLNGAKSWTGFADDRGVVQQSVTFAPGTASGSRLVRVSGYRLADYVYRDFTVTTTVKYLNP
jgi:hypothetical protein